MAFNLRSGSYHSASFLGLSYSVEPAQTRPDKYARVKYGRGREVAGRDK